MENSTKYLGIAAIVISLLGGGYLYYTGTRGVSMEGIVSISEDYLASVGDSDLEVGEIMEFKQNYYVVFNEESTGMGAFEMLVDKNSGQIFPEYGPNMMWNLKYGSGGMMSGRGGMMGGFGGMMSGPGGMTGTDYGSMMGGYIPQEYSDEPIGEAEAMELAQGFLDVRYSGAEADDPHPFYGYYTIHTTMDGEIFGMLSVNAFSGQVWYHSWHGDFVGMTESH